MQRARLTRSVECGDPEDMGYELRATCARRTLCGMRGCGHGGARAEKGARRDGEEEEGHAPLVAGEDRRVDSSPCRSKFIATLNAAAREAGITSLSVDDMLS